MYQQNQMIIEPHGAVAWSGLEEFLKEHPVDLPCISFETADPAKFPEAILDLLGIQMAMTENMKNQAERRECIRNLSTSYPYFKYLLYSQYEGRISHDQQNQYKNRNESRIDTRCI